MSFISLKDIRKEGQEELIGKREEMCFTLNALIEQSRETFFYKDAIIEFHDQFVYAGIIASENLLVLGVDDFDWCLRNDFLYYEGFLNSLGFMLGRDTNRFYIGVYSPNLWSTIRRTVKKALFDLSAKL